MVVGMTSLDDWPWLTSSLGCTSFEPNAPPRSSVARLAITSLALVFVEFAIRDFLGRLRDRVGLARIDQPQIAVRHSRGVFDGPERPDEAAVEPFPADGKVLEGAPRGSAVVRALGYLERAHGVAFDALGRSAVTVTVRRQLGHSNDCSAGSEREYYAAA